jgi:glyoxylase-like metal-dependent hydrolase (beta-lactamase superfamily II)
MQVSKSVYVVNGGYYGNLGNVFAIRGEKSIALIDTGELPAVETIFKSLKDWGLANLPITHVLLTHGHQDHAGAAAHFKNKGARICCSEADAWQVRQGGLLPSEYPGLLWSFTPCEPDEIVKDGDTVHFEDFSIRVIAAPGHTAGSVVYELKDGDKSIFFTGDLLSCDGERGELVILGWKGSPDYSPDSYLKTLDKIFRMEPDLVLGGHGIPCMADGNRVLRNAYLKALLELR